MYTLGMCSHQGSGPGAYCGWVGEWGDDRERRIWSASGSKAVCGSIPTFPTTWMFNVGIPAREPPPSDVDHAGRHPHPLTQPPFTWRAMAPAGQTDNEVARTPLARTTIRDALDTALIALTAAH